MSQQARNNPEMYERSSDARAFSKEQLAMIEELSIDTCERHEGVPKEKMASGAYRCPECHYEAEFGSF